MNEQLFGANVRNLVASDPAALLNEKELLDALVEKVGPFADKHKLLYHIRVSAGKIHWAVNSYFRSILAVAPAAGSREDFDSKSRHSLLLSAQRPAADATPAGIPQLARAPAAAGADSHLLSTDNQQQASKHASLSVAADAVYAAATEHGAAEASPTLDGLPTNILESILLHLDVEAVLCAASSCKTLYRVAQAERIWQNLFRQQWGSAIFPTSKKRSNGNVQGRAIQATPCAPEHQSASDSAGGAVDAAVTATASGSVAQVVCDQAAAVPPADVASVQVIGAASCRASQPRLPLPDPAAGEVSATALLGANSSGSMLAVTAPAAILPSQRTLMQPLASPGPATANSRNSCRNFVGRWTGSCLPSKCGNAATSAFPTSTTNSTQCSQSHGDSACGSCTCTCQKQQQQQQQNCSGALCCGSCCAMLQQRAPAGSWKAQYKKQYNYQALRRCPKCEDESIVPIVYGFPSAPLLAGMNCKRLVLGGDHLIEACHVWACSGCRSCFRYFPYTAVHLWLQDDEAQQRLDQARAAAGRSSRRGSAGDSDLQAAGQLPLPGEEEAAAAGMPRYTYEL